MTLDDRYSAWLDGELAPDEAAAVEAEVAADPALAAEVDALRSVRSLLRAQGPVDVYADAGERLVARLEAAAAASRSEAGRGAASRATVVPLARRRRVPTLAAVAASFAIIVSVIGGVGGSSTLPAVGDLIARHDAAAAVMPHDPMASMPDDMPSMPGKMDMMHADLDGSVVHALYALADGSAVSVFRHDGELDEAGLVDDMGGEVGEMAGHAMWAADIGRRHVAVLDGDGYVWTIVSDVETDPMSDLMHDVMTDLPERSPSIAERLHDMAEAVVEPFDWGR